MIGLLEQYLKHRAVLIVDNVIERGSSDFVTEVASELPLQAIAEIMGVPQEDRRLIFEWSNRMIGIDDPEFASDDGATAFIELYTYVNELGKQRRSDPRQDIVTKLINSEIAGDRLSELEFDMFMLLLSVAGNETTRNATAWGMLALMQNPMRTPPSSRTRPSWTWRPMRSCAGPRRCCISGAPLQRTPRSVARPSPKTTKVVMWYISANRDEDVFNDPFTFDIERNPNPHIAFGGGGAHFCLGANLARMELRLIFDEIVQRIPDMHMTGEPQFLRSNFIGGIKHMPVAFTPAPRQSRPARRQHRLAVARAPGLRTRCRSHWPTSGRRNGANPPGTPQPGHP